MIQKLTLQENLARISTDGTPALRSFAPWLLDNLSLAAFSSVRGLAKQAGVNPNTVTRLAAELGYPGYDALRADVQEMLHSAAPSYGQRARALKNRADSDVFSAVIESNAENARSIFAPDTLQILASCVQPLLNARRIYAVGVRSCYSIAHYFTYVGGMAFPNFVAVPSMPGAIVDQFSQVTADDIVVGITYAHYSAEVVLACRIARDNGARVLALTDSYSSPVAIGAWKVLRLPMAGPHLLPSLNSAFLAVEMLLAGMAAGSEDAATCVSAYEDRIRQNGGYAPTGRDAG